MTERTTRGKGHIIHMHIIHMFNEIAQDNIRAFRLILLHKIVIFQENCTLASLKVCSLKRITHRRDLENKQIKTLCSNKFEKH